MIRDRNIPSDVKDGIREKYGQTMLKLSTANQDYTALGLVVEE